MRKRLSEGGNHSMDIRTGTLPKRKKTKSQLDWKFCLLRK
ncbi:hypothetical protein CLOLEP_02019 [[Clostridium] leptum DSM 753]|uniref:Uncharacterized protein n=1 Tax=[Clostridium] leptum DSM 753 TaxID=428125 RepID=A7VTX5_9FIRM|nr:hypothetical protein CLOLEP_02019 [[Clostridium] leptum DSM 753]